MPNKSERFQPQNHFVFKKSKIVDIKWFNIDDNDCNNCNNDVVNDDDDDDTGITGITGIGTVRALLYTCVFVCVKQKYFFARNIIAVARSALLFCSQLCIFSPFRHFIVTTMYVGGFPQERSNK